MAGLLSAILGLFVLVGWLSGVPWIKSVLPGAVTMKANTAAAFLLGGGSLWFFEAHGNGIRSRFGQVLGAGVALIGSASLIEYVFGWRLGIDELLFRDETVAYNVLRGRMSPYSAVAFTAIGIGMALLPARSLRWLVWMTGTLTLLIGGLAFLGYLWSATELVTDRFLPPVAVNTAVGFIILGLGTLIAGRAPAAEPPGPSVPLSAIEIRTLIGFLAALSLLLLTGGQTYRAAVAAQESAHWVVHTLQVRSALQRLSAALSEAESEERAYLLGGNPDFLGAYKRNADEANQQTEALAQLIADNPDQVRKFKELRLLLRRRLAGLGNSVDSLSPSGNTGAQGLATGGEARRLGGAIRLLISQMNSLEDKLLEAREADASRDQAKTLLYLLVTVSAAVAGFLTLYSGIRREMAARTLAEDSLRRSEENLAVTLHSIGDAVLATDTERRITRLNPVAEKLTGWTQADAAGHLVDEVFRIVNEETRKPAVIPVEKVLATGEIHGLANHTVLIARDGTERAIADSAAPIREAGGRILGVVLVFRDVTAEQAARKALQESEERYRTLFNSIDEGFCIIEMIFDQREKSVDYRFLEINQSFERQTGLIDAQGKTMRQLAPEHEQHWFDIYGRIALTGEPARFQNRAEQLHRTYDVYAFRFGDPANRRVAILFNDISERKMTEERIVRLNADLASRASELEAANKELESFSYAVSHDLRAPLRHVQGYVELLTRELPAQLSDQGRRYLKTITKAAQDMGLLIDELLSFSRSARTEMREIAVDLDKMIQDVLRGMELAVRGRNIVWKIASLPRARGDPPMLRQVWANLLGNAVKYTRGRSPAQIEIGVAGAENGRIILFVRDNGAGFDMKYADKLFGVFQRLHRAEEFEGTGIGLANVRRIVSRHGGRTWAEGKLGEGATFYFTLAPAAEGSPSNGL
jgi:PAS domain S-box-containing protein